MGESLLLPVYWDEMAASMPEAYAPEYARQYFFGSELLAAPISDAVDNTTGVVQRTVWLPPSANGWYDFATMSRIHANANGCVTRGYGLGDIPLFVRGGAVLPTRTMVSAYLSVADPLVWVVAPGANAGNGTVYEDDGDTMLFRNGQFQTTTLAYAIDGQTTTITLTPLHSDGGFIGAPAHRDQWVALRGFVKLPSSASCDGSPLTLRDIGQSPGFWLDPAAGNSLVVACGNTTSFGGVHTISLRQ